MAQALLVSFILLSSKILKMTQLVCHLLFELAPEQICVSGDLSSECYLAACFEDRSTLVPSLEKIHFECSILW